MGTVKKTSLDEFNNPRKGGIIAVNLDDGDFLIGAALTDGKHDVMLFSDGGKAVRFDENDVRPLGRSARGVRGMSLKDGDEVISLSVLHRAGVADQDEREDYLRHAPWKGEDAERTPRAMDDARFADLAAREQFLLTVCSNGYGKLSSAYEYRRTGRGGQGITNIDNIARNGPVVASFPVERADQLMLVTDQAKLIRLPLTTLRVIGRGTAGVRLFNVSDSESVVGAVRLLEAEGGEDEIETEVSVS
jgi:DNA gyrase subunit A